MTSRPGIVASQGKHGEAPPAATWALRATNSALDDRLANRVASGGGKIIIPGVDRNTNRAFINISSDGGVTWARQYVAALAAVNVLSANSIAYGGGYFVAIWVKLAGPTPALVVSADDGVTWADVGAQGHDALFDICYALGSFLALGRAAGLCRITRSDTPLATPWLVQNTAFIGGLPTFCATGDGVIVLVADNQAWHSPNNGGIWQAHVLNGSGSEGLNHNGLAGAAGMFAVPVGIGAGGKAGVCTSPDGQVWTARDAGFAVDDILVGVANNGEPGAGNLWLVISSSWAGYSFATSADNGVTWDPQNDAIYEDVAPWVYGLSFADGLFIAGASISDSDEDRILTYG